MRIRRNKFKNQLTERKILAVWLSVGEHKMDRNRLYNFAASHSYSPGNLALKLLNIPNLFQVGSTYSSLEHWYSDIIKIFLQSHEKKLSAYQELKIIM